MLVVLGVQSALAGIGVALALVAGPPAAATPEMVWTDEAAPVATSSDPALVRQRPVRVDRARLDALTVGDRVDFELFDNRVVVGSAQRHRREGADRYTLSGTIDGVAGGAFVLARQRDAVVGLVMLGPEGRFRLEMTAGGRHRLLQVDSALAPLECEVAQGASVDVSRPDAPADPAAISLDSVTGVIGCGTECPVVIDVLAIFSPQTASVAGGAAALEAELDMAIEVNNLAYANSGIAAELNLVYAYQVPWNQLYGIPLSWVLDPDDGVLDGVHDLRNAYGADIVAVIREGSGGYAYGLTDFVNTRGPDAYCSLGRDQLFTTFVLSHEIGHLLGCCHALGDGGGCAPGGGLLFNFSNGYRFLGASNTLWHTIMAYTPGLPILHFSNPEVAFDGTPTGVDSLSPGRADNARTINLSKAFVANYRRNDKVCESLDLSSIDSDCNGNLIPDACDVALGNSQDVNQNGIPDECELDMDGNAPLHDDRATVDTGVPGALGGGAVVDGGPSDHGAPSSGAWTDLGQGLGTAGNAPVLAGSGALLGGQPTTLTLSNGAPNATAWLVLGFSQVDVPLHQGVLVPYPDRILAVSLDGSGSVSGSIAWPAGLPSGATLYYQFWIPDAAGPEGYTASNGLASTTP